MLFQSYTYLFLFLPLVVTGYVLLRRTTWHNLFLLLASYIFYCYGNAWLLLYILFSSTLDYAVAPLIERTTQPGRRRALLAVSLAGNLGLLFALKYALWITGLLEGVSGMHIPLPPGLGTGELTLPPGISFYTFQSLSYTIDVYRRERGAERNAVDFYTYVALFPQLVAGPIERSTTLLPQLKAPRVLPSIAIVESSLFFIAWGLFKKLVIADNLGNVVDLMTAEPTLVPGAAILMPYAFSMQIYCDFSAYTDIARGSAALLGIELSRNFLTPYFSTGPSEFWRRWHITLSRWLRDYLYIPLGGGHHGTGRTLRNLMITMFLGGLWHGAGGFFILWGLYHGALLVLYYLVPIDRILKKRLGTFGQALSILLCFHLITAGWFLFRTTPQSASALLHALPLFEFNETFFQFLKIIVLASLPIVLTDYIAWRNNVELPDLYERFSLSVRAGFWVVIYFAIVIFARREGYGFIYFSF